MRADFAKSAMLVVVLACETELALLVEFLVHAARCALGAAGGAYLVGKLATRTLLAGFARSAVEPSFGTRSALDGALHARWRGLMAGWARGARGAALSVVVEMIRASLASGGSFRVIEVSGRALEAFSAVQARILADGAGGARGRSIGGGYLATWAQLADVSGGVVVTPWSAREAVLVYVVVHGADRALCAGSLPMILVDESGRAFFALASFLVVEHSWRALCASLLVRVNLLSHTADLVAAFVTVALVLVSLWASAAWFAVVGVAELSRGTQVA